MPGKIMTIEISRGTTHDGPGMRTTVFAKGCPLSCRWCQNPEGIRPTQEIWWEARKCIGCLECIGACENRALDANDGQIHINRKTCKACGSCVEACPSGALAYVGKEWTEDELVREVLKDRHYYSEFGGGVTVSGGEPLLYADFLEGFFKRLHLEGVHTALDTCGCISQKALLRVLKHADALLYDMKLFDSVRHKEFTGHGNERIIDNLLSAAALIRNTKNTGQQKPLLWIRTPLIPDATATRENISQIAEFIKEELLDIVDRWELCAFNTACISKYDHMGLSWFYEDVPLLRQDLIDELKEEAFAQGIPNDILLVTGMISQG